jgi:hypothetical protein
MTFSGKQDVNVTGFGVAVNVGGAGGQAPAPWPVRLTVTFAAEVPSDTPTLTVAVPVLETAGDGFLREIVTVFPEMLVASASLPELWK